MGANVCPHCGKAVMPYRRFLREAEPYKASACGSCGANLRRSPKGYLFLLIMLILLCASVLPLFSMLAKARISFWIIGALLIVLLAAWSLLTNFLAWRLIGWVPETPTKSGGARS